MRLGQIEQLVAGHDEAAAGQAAPAQGGSSREFRVKEHFTGVLVDPHHCATRAQWRH